MSQDSYKIIYLLKQALVLGLKAKKPRILSSRKAQHNQHKWLIIYFFRGVHFPSQYLIVVLHKSIYI